MRKWDIIVAVVAFIIVTIVGLFSLLAIGVRQMAIHGDVDLVAYEACHVLQENQDATDAEILAAVKCLQNSSVTYARLGQDGVPRDCYGNEFQIVHDITEGKLTVQCTTAGPDRILGTNDDMSCTVQKVLGAPNPRVQTDAASRSDGRDDR